MIAIAFIAFAVMAIIHFVYENCILPELRLSSQYRLFALRDELRELRYQKRIENDESYDVLQRCINNAITFSSTSDALLLFQVNQAMKENPELEALAKSRISILDNDPSEDVSLIRRKMRHETMLSVVAGMAMLYLYLIPIVVFALLFKQVKEILRVAITTDYPNNPRHRHFSGGSSHQFCVS